MPSDNGATGRPQQVSAHRSPTTGLRNNSRAYRLQGSR